MNRGAMSVPQSYSAEGTIPHREGFMRLSLIVVILFAALLAQAQEVKPTSLTIEAVPGYTSPQQNVEFFNTGDSEITLTISISGPFAIPTNKCGRGVKPGTHCDVWVTYSPQVIGTDTGTLTFIFNEQGASIPLTGNAIDIIPTSTRIQEIGKKQMFKTTVSIAQNGYVVPNGEQIYVKCSIVSGPYKGYGVYATATLQNGVAYISNDILTGEAYASSDSRGVPDRTGHYMWYCISGYGGDSEFASSDSDGIIVWSY